MIEKIKNKDAVIGIVGLGYVGLPMAYTCTSAGYKVFGFDVSDEKIKMLEDKKSYINDISDDQIVEMYDNQFNATSDFKLINEIDIVVICVPTPLNQYKEPEMDYIISATNSIASNLSHGTLVILESTTYPGTTEEVVKPIIDEKNLTIGQDYFLAYSPERVDPGNEKFNTSNTPKVVGGCTNDCNNFASEFYKNILSSDVHLVSSPGVAEMEKLLENTFRHINIGLANEMAIICEKLNLNVWEVINAAATKPYGFMPFYPGPGLGGHCIPIDPWYLSWKIKEQNYITKLIGTSSEINDQMPEYIIDRLFSVLNKFKKSINGSNIVVFGLAYKKNISDYRESPAVVIIKRLQELGANVTIVDPHVAQINSPYEVVEKIEMDSLNNYDLSLILTDHKEFDFECIVEKSVYTFDTRNTLNRHSNNDYEVL
ncbi:nucleotide sugar dehydrogenase [Abyssicoccus albus]|uniref:nucleotide sugar dehydrogenase n=1 Tax=Abyssicoccus albus TaxID=1817405 RepID=UPI00097E2384|nr:nucleotide sugar dehydrogenase [Abyssicoccus albus]AQL55897.1 UDP-N-acetyl-D-glucosamine dehydrogenase [Abyssicoccus albus]